MRHQQERDVAALLPSIHHLTERNRQLYFLLQTVIVSHEPSALVGLTDADVAEAAAAAAATVETEAKGVIYEHVPTSPPAQELAAALRKAIEDARQHGATIYDGEAVLVLRAIADGARSEAATSGHGGYIGLVRRLLGAPEPSLVRERATGGSIILP